MPKPSWSFPALALLCLAAASARAEDGLQLPQDVAAWPRWQTRIGLSTTGSTAADRSLSGRPGLTGAAVLADVYLSGPGFGNGSVSGGLRATSGLLVGNRVASFGAPAFGAGQPVSLTLTSPSAGFAGASVAEPAVTAQPYFGVGYTGVAQRGAVSFSADLGFVGSTNGNGLRVGRPAIGIDAGAGGVNLDDLLRDLRLSPVLRLGVSYAF